MLVLLYRTLLLEAMADDEIIIRQLVDSLIAVPELFIDDSFITDLIATTPGQVIPRILSEVKFRQTVLKIKEQFLEQQRKALNKEACVLIDKETRFQESFNTINEILQQKLHIQNSHEYPQRIRLDNISFFVFGIICIFLIIQCTGTGVGTGVGTGLGGGGKSKSPVSKNTRRKSNPMDYYVHQHVQLGGTLNDDKAIQKFVKDSYKKYPELKKKVVEMYTI